jgi:tetratricopeptide (TPR) repeat protein
MNRNFVLLALFSVALLAAPAPAPPVEDNSIVAAIRQGRFAEAEAALKQRLASKPGDAVALSMLAAVLDQQGKCSEAEAAYKTLLARGGASPVLLNNAGNHYVACGDPAKASGYFEKLLAANPAHPNANLQLARLAVERKQGQRALQLLAWVGDRDDAVALLKAEALHWAGQDKASLALFEKLDRELANDADASYALALACVRAGFYDLAEPAFARIVAHSPEDFDVLLNMGRAAARAGHYERAREILESALKLQPDHVDALAELGRTRAALRDYESAVVVLARARELAPRRADVLLALARAAEDALYYGDSVLAYDEYLKLRPNDADAKRDRASVQARIERNVSGAGLDGLKAHVAQFPNDAVGHYGLAMALSFTELDRAVAELDVALRIDPTLAGAYYARAMALHQLGRTAEAIPDLETALTLTPEDAKSIDLLGLAYLTLNKPAAAEAVLRRGLALPRPAPEIYMHLAQALQALHRTDEAKDYFARFRSTRVAARALHTSPWLIAAASWTPAEARRRVIDQLHKSIPGDRMNPKLHAELGSVLMADGQMEAASQEYREALALSLSVELLRNEGAAMLRFEQYELAREFLIRAVEKDPQARVDLTIATLFAGGARAALECLEATPAEQRSGDYYLLKASLLDTLGHAAESEQALLMTRGQPFTRPAVARQAASLMVRRGRLFEALAVVDEALVRTPDNSDLLLMRGMILALAGRPSEAERQFALVETRWPEWNRGYLAHALALERVSRTADARRKLRTAMALGAKDALAQCAYARITGASAPECVCPSDLGAFATNGCRAR